jgi:hypothetical protein
MRSMQELRVIDWSRGRGPQIVRGALSKSSVMRLNIRAVCRYMFDSLSRYLV